MLLLASASPRRLALLAQIGVTPDQVIPAHIDETPHKNEKPLDYVKRMAHEKAAAIAAQHPKDLVLAADTIVVCGRRILPKAEDAQTAKQCLEILSSRRHRVYTAICAHQQERVRERVVMTQVAMHRLSPQEIVRYVESKEWHGKAGGYGIQGHAEVFISRINGSYSNVVGLPLAETRFMLQSFGVKGL